MKTTKRYRLLVKVYNLFSGKMSTTWDVPFDGQPCVFIGNHSGLYGPLDMCAKFPVRDAHPWFNAAVAEPKEMPAYVRQDYWWKPGCFFEPLLNITVPYIAAAILPPIMRCVPGVRVYHDMRVVKTFKESIRILQDREHLIIFPEQPSGWLSHHNWINTGFLQLAPMYYKRTGKAIKFWPVHIDHKNKTFHVASPISYDPSKSLEDQMDDFTRVLAAGLRGEKLSPS